LDRLFHTETVFFVDMRISYKQLKKLSVETTLGIVLGSVDDIVLDIDAQHIVQYEVRHSLLSSKLHTISREQVVSITKEKMVVEDAVVPNAEQERGLNQLWKDSRLTSQKSLQEKYGE